MTEPNNQSIISSSDPLLNNNLPFDVNSSDPTLIGNGLTLATNSSAASSSEAIAIVSETDPDLILLDAETETSLLLASPDQSNSSLNNPELGISVDTATSDDPLIGRIDNSEPQGLLGGEPGDTLIGTAESHVSENLPTEDLVVNPSGITEQTTQVSQDVILNTEPPHTIEQNSSSGEQTTSLEIQVDKVPSAPNEVLVETGEEFSASTTNPLSESVEAKPDPTSIETDSSTAIALNPTNLKSSIQETFTSGVFTVGSSGEVGIDFLYDGGRYQGQLAIFSLEGMESYQPGSSDFIQEAALRASSSSELGHIAINDLAEGARFTGNLEEPNQNKGEYQGVKSFALKPGSSFGIMLVPNGKVAEVAENPSIQGNKRPLFSMVTANPNEGFHVGQIADITGEGNTFVIEDLRVDQRTDRDYNDIIFQIRGAIGAAVLMDEVVVSSKDWRVSDLGNALIAYAKSYINPDFVETQNSVNQTADPIGNTTSIQSNTSVEIRDTTVQLSPVEVDSVLSSSSNQDISPLASSIPEQTSVNLPEDQSESETLQIEFTPDQLVPISEAEQLIQSIEIMRSQGLEIPNELLALAQNSLAAAQELPSGTIDLTEEIVPTPSLSSLQIIQPPETDKNQPLVGAITATNNQPQNWAKPLIAFVNTAIQSGQQNAIINLNIDLTQTQNNTPLELTTQEKAALIYAQNNNILVVIPVGDTPGQTSPLAQFTQEFDKTISIHQGFIQIGLST